MKFLKSIFVAAALLWSLPAQAAIDEVNAGNFTRVVLESKTPVLVQFDAKWCPYCRQFQPRIKALDDSRAVKMKIVRLDVDASRDIMQKYSIKSLPTVIAFHRGREFTRAEGALQADELTTWATTVERTIEKSGAAVPASDQTEPGYDGNNAQPDRARSYDDMNLKVFSD
jgi:thioredoxin 2